MKYAASVLSATGVAIFAAYLAAGTSQWNPAAGASARAAETSAEKPAKKKSGGPPPLVVDRNAPLLLEEMPDEAPKNSAKKTADNSACHVCHTNYEAEELAVVHAKEDVGCIKCHGKSYAHRDDEDNITPPDTMYPLDVIDKACEECHEEHDVAAVKVIARWQERCPEKKNAEWLVCTDCHGQHRLKLRTVRWNKRTGEVIVRGEQGAKTGAN